MAGGRALGQYVLGVSGPALSQDACVSLPHLSLPDREVDWSGQTRGPGQGWREGDARPPQGRVFLFPGRCCQALLFLKEMEI